jgi:hypothetical protein
VRLGVLIMNSAFLVFKAHLLRSEVTESCDSIGRVSLRALLELGEG